MYKGGISSISLSIEFHNLKARIRMRSNTEFKTTPSIMMEKHFIERMDVQKNR